MSLHIAATNESFDTVPTDNSSVIRSNSRSFTFASRLLPVSVRSDVQKLYAWCRWCDDAVDSAPDLQASKRRLITLREDVYRIYRGQEVEHGASKWLKGLVQSHGIDRACPLALLDGMEMDLKLGQIKNQSQLLQYCYRAAGIVGLMLCKIFKVQDSRAMRHASALGTAMQLTNIARDVLEDSHRGRCYLPETWLPSGIGSASESDIRSAVRRILDLAEQYYLVAEAGMSYLPASVRPAIRVAAAVYREIGTEIANRDCSVMQSRVVVPKTRFLLVGLTAMFAGLLRDAKRRIATTISPPEISSKNYSNDFHREIAMNDAKYIGWLGISLTAFMGSALFLLVLVNPKDVSYSSLPLFYSVACFLIGVTTNLLAKHEERVERVPVTATSGASRRDS